MTLQLYWPIAKVDRDQREVYGYASTEATDSQGEIVTREALEAALPAYMRFANIREMHLPSAVGVAREAVVDDKGLWLKASIVDDEAWRKVTAGVYKGFSIGGAVTARAAEAPHIVTGLDLTEISLVDRPANPEAVFAVWKSADGDARLDEAALKAARSRLAQKWVASDGSAFVRAEEAARHEMRIALPNADAARRVAKTSFAPASAPTSGLTSYDLDGAAGEDRDDRADYADPGYQPDGKRRYPLDSAARIRAAWSYIHHKPNQKPYSREQLDSIKAKIVAAWKAKIDRDGPSAARAGAGAADKIGKALQDAARLASLVEELDWLRDALTLLPAGDDLAASTIPAIETLCQALHAMIDDGTSALTDDDEDGPGDDALVRAAAAVPRGGAAALIKLLRQRPLAGDSALRARTAALEAELGRAVPLLLQVKELVEKVAAQPAVVPPSRLVAIDKSADVARELERIAEQPPAMTAFELIRRAVREPLPFGGRLAKE